MNQLGYVDYSLNFNAFTKLLFNKKHFIHEEKLLNFISHYETEWKLIVSEWSVFYTSTLCDTDCTTTQRHHCIEEENDSCTTIGNYHFNPLQTI